jgi:hypothetical protein
VAAHCQTQEIIMNRVFPTTSRRVFASLALASAALCGGLPHASAAGLACQPSIFVNNNKAIAVKVLKVAYRVNNGAWKEEGLDNKTLARNESGTDDEHTWRSQKLQDIAEGLPLTEITIQYKEDNSGGGDGFGPPGWSTPSSHSGTCQDSDTYHHTISATSAHTPSKP